MLREIARGLPAQDASQIKDALEGEFCLVQTWSTDGARSALHCDCDDDDLAYLRGYIKNWNVESNIENLRRITDQIGIGVFFGTEMRELLAKNRTARVAAQILASELVKGGVVR